MEEDNTSFDQQWNKAFADAEIAPPEHVWVGIDGQLSGAAASSYKSQLVIYRRVAAACILLLMLFGSGYWYDQNNISNSMVSDKKALNKTSEKNQKNNNQQTITPNTADLKTKRSKNNAIITENTGITISSVKDSGISGSSSVAQSLTAPHMDNVHKDITNNTLNLKDEAANTNNTITESDQVVVFSEEKSRKSSPLEERFEDNITTDNNSISEAKTPNTSPPLIKHSQIAVIQTEDLKALPSEVKQLKKMQPQYDHIFNTTMDSKDLEGVTNITEPPKYIYGVPIIPSNSELQEINKLWAGVIMSTGSFNPSINLANSDDASLTADFEDFSPNTPLLVNEQEVIQDINEEPVNYNLASSVSGGLSVGSRVKNRFIISSGLTFNTISTSQSSTSLINQNGDVYAITGDHLDDNLTSAINDSNIEFEGTTVNLSNEYKYLSVPLKAGYILLDKKFNITFNTGVSSNFLLDAQLVTNGSTQSINNDLNSRSAYKDVYFNLLTSLELGYLIAKKYQVSLEPNYSRALTNFSESNNLGNKKPTNLGISLGVKYNF